MVLIFDYFETLLISKSIGDLYESDVVGAYNAGIKAAWLNKKNEEDTKGIAAYNVSSIAELTELIIRE